MSPKQWLALLCFFVSYLFFGASVFYHIEQDLETERRVANKLQRFELHELITASIPHNETIVEEIYKKVGDLCGENVHVHAPVKPYQWTFYHSFFFSFIVCSTIGYGNISPHSAFGMMFMILYALIGIPVNGFLFAGLGDFFGKTFVGIYNRYRIYKMATTKNYMPMRFTLIGRILLYLMPGMVFFIFIPSCLFSYFEDWPYTTSIYYSFVTLTTIGFGDYVATFNSNSENEFGYWFYFYETFVILWFIFGLGYLVMILGFIAKGMRSKRITRLERQLAGNIKATQQRIWHGVTKDVGYLRRILNELYMMKFKPVYTDEDADYAHKLHRSASCPDLQLYRNDDDDGFAPPAPRRRRAVSVPYCEDTIDSNGRRTASMVRIQSDTDLHRIDRERTFDVDGSMPFSNEHILAKVVSALGNIRPAYDEDGHSVLDMAAMEGGGVHGFSDADILASEYVASGWTLNQSMDSGGSYAMPNQRRARAASVFSVPTLSGGDAAHQSNGHEWTWSGQNAAQVQEFLRGKTKPRKQSLFRNVFTKDSSGSISTMPAGSTEKMDRSRNASVSITMPPSSSLPDVPTSTTTTTTSTAPLFTKMNPFRRRILGEHGHRHSLTGLEEMTPSQYLERSARGRPSQPFGPKQYLQATARGRKSAFSVMTTAEPAHDDLLENTTIADLIRALEVVHTTVQRDQILIGSGSPGGAGDEMPRRKMGLASLTPPKMSPPSAMRSAAARRGSLRPTPTYTTIFNSKLHQPSASTAAAVRAGRRQSQHFTAGIAETTSAQMDVSAAAEHPQPPPPYDVWSASRASLKNRRFSVRPTNLSMAPGQVFQIPSVQAQSAVQRRMSMKPSPLARGIVGQSSARFARDRSDSINSRGAVAQAGSESPRMARQQPSGAAVAAAGRSVMWRPKLVQVARTRHGSWSELQEERNERKRSDSK